MDVEAPSAKLFARVFYVGTSFHGFQRQPGVRTVEGVIIEALRSLGAMRDPRESMYAAASRTDKGVHGLGQTIAFIIRDPLQDPVALLHDLNELLRGDEVILWAYALRPVEEHPRRDALYRTYIYVEPRRYGDIDIKAIKKLKGWLLGSHDFTHFVPEAGKPAVVRRILSLDVGVEGDLVVIVIRANAFARHLVRKLVPVIMDVAYGRLDPDSAYHIVLGGRPGPYLFRLAPSENLALLNVSYSFMFNVLHKWAQVVKEFMFSSRYYPLKLLGYLMSGAYRGDSNVMLAIMNELMALGLADPPSSS